MIYLVVHIVIYTYTIHIIKIYKYQGPKKSYEQSAVADKNSKEIQDRRTCSRNAVCLANARGARFIQNAFKGNKYLAAHCRRTDQGRVECCEGMRFQLPRRHQYFVVTNLKHASHNRARS